MARVKTAEIIAERDELLERNIEVVSLLDAAEQRVAKLEEQLDRSYDSNDNLASSLVDARLQEGELVNIVDELGAMVEEAALRIDTLTGQRQFLAQTLVAIAHYRGDDPTVPVFMADAAVVDFLPASESESDLDEDDE